MSDRSCRSWALAFSLGLVACGPMIELESDSTTGSESAGTAEVTTAGPTTTPPTTAGPTTAGPTTAGPTTTPPPDTGPFDTGDFIEPTEDFPEFCSTIEQDCPPGFKCMPFSNDGGGAWNATMCVEIVPDPSAPGEPCMVEGNGLNGLDDCDGTSMCWDVDPKTNEGVCQPFCTGTEDNPTCSDPCDWCAISGDGAITLCFDICDPLAQDCAPGDACYPVNGSFACIPDASEGMGTLGAPCEYINVCTPGLACMSGESFPGCDTVGCCTPFCPVNGADPCPGLVPGTVCVPLFEDPPPPGCVLAEPGVCLTP